MVDEVYYSTVQEVIEDSGIQPVDIGFSDTDNLTADEQLEVKIIKWLVIAKSYIDSECDQNFNVELADGTITEIPVCIDDIARRITINMANSAKLNRKSPIIKVNDYSVKPVTNNPFTPEIRTDLAICSPKIIDSSIDSPFGMFTINEETYEDDEDNRVFNPNLW
jgi:hypothetical protein